MIYHKSPAISFRDRKEGMGKGNYENHSTYTGNKNYSLVGKGIHYE
tara:strand:- start:322 stop:459 length:138 start_codon:yes stop_codon:yes gene_type:complete